MYWLQQARSVAGNHIWTAVNEIYNLQSLSQARSVAGNHIWTAVNEIYNLQSLSQARSAAIKSLSQARSAAIKDWLQQSRTSCSKIRSNQGSQIRTNPNPRQAEQTSHATKSLTLAMPSKP
jgi:hypothetical protein